MFGLLFGAILLVLGIVFFIIGRVSTKRSQIARTWPTVPGSVVRSEVVTHTEYDSDNNASTSYEPVVCYQYSLMGQTVTGTRIAYGANRFSYKKSFEICSQYPLGAQVLVHYNPEKVEDATLEVVARGGKTFTVVGVVCLVLGVLGLLYGLISL